MSMSFGSGSDRVAAFVTDEHGRILGCTREAAALLDRRPELVLCLTAWSREWHDAPGSATKLQRQLSSHDEKSRLWLEARWLSLETPIEATGGGSQPRVLVTVRESQDVKGTPGRPLHDFGFTPAERRVAAGVAAGLNLQSIAAEHELSLHTVRSHLKRIFLKTGVHTQAALVRVLLKHTERPASGQLRHPQARRAAP